MPPAPVLVLAIGYHGRTDARTCIALRGWRRAGAGRWAPSRNVIKNEMDEMDEMDETK